MNKFNRCHFLDLSFILYRLSKDCVSVKDCIVLMERRVDSDCGLYEIKGEEGIGWMWCFSRIK